MGHDRIDATLAIFYRTERVGAVRLSDGGAPFGFDITADLRKTTCTAVISCAVFRSSLPQRSPPAATGCFATLDATRRRPGGRVGHEQVAAIREAFAVYQEADVMRGGGHARRALAQYVTGHVLPLVRDVDPETDTGAALFAAASEQTYLLGWMAFDDGRQALAQRYLVQSLRLAQASGDAMLGSHVLAGLSDQARMLGYPHEALHLAAAGRHGLSRAYSPACAADLWALQGRAHATLGESRDAAHAVAQYENAFTDIQRDDEPGWTVPDLVDTRL